MVKKLLVLVLIVFSTCILISCKKKEAKYISSVSEFDAILNESIKYDIRSTEDCEKGHIPTFSCMGGISDNKKLVDTILLTVTDKDKKIVIISFGNDIDRLNEIFNLLIKEKYNNLFSFEGGYEKYAELKGSSFIPEEGCDC